MADFLLDTDVLLRCLRGLHETLALARSLAEQGELHISTLSLLEILAFAQPKEEKRTLEFLAPFLHEPLNDEIAERAARLARAAAAAPGNITFPDAIIAATAMRSGLTLVTYSADSFAYVPELRLYKHA